MNGVFSDSSKADVARESSPGSAIAPAPAKGKSGRISFAALAAAFVAVRLPWLFMIPMQEAPDEFAHYWVIKFLREHWRLPSSAEVLAGGPSAVYGSLPQLGYIPHVAACTVGGVDTIPLLSRFGSLAMGLVLLFATWRCARILFNGNALLALALPLALILHPQMIFLHSYANCDATSTALSGILIWLMLETVVSGMKVGRTALMGALAGWLALTKYSALAILPVLALAVVSSCFIHATPLTVSVPGILIGALVAASVSGWWFWRNFNEFDGDVLGTRTMYKTWATTFHRELNYSISPWRIIKDLRWWRMMYFSYWGLFGYMNKYMWRPAYLAYVGFLLAAVAGGCVVAVARLKSLAGKSVKFMIPADKESRVNLLKWACLTLVPVINLLSMIWASTQNLGGPQGRYLFNSEIPVLALLLVGLSRLPRIGNKAVVAFLIFNAIVSVTCWIWLFNLYGGFRINPLPN